MKRDAFLDQHQRPFPFDREQLADNFAGGGGASEAIRLAYGRDPDIAVNHDGEALCMHAANHPTTLHCREDVFLIDPSKVTKNLPVGMVWFSPTCTHFSKAKGHNILNQRVRGLAWVVFKWGVHVAPRMMCLENVEEFSGWGPLDDKGKPIKALKGRTFAAFIDGLTTGLSPDHPDVEEIRAALGEDFPMSALFRGLGYKVEWRNLHAHHFGAGTRRKRLYMVMRRDGRPIVWPKPTHGPANSPDVLSGKLLPEAITGDNIDWSIPTRSIFDRKKPLKPLVKPTLRRIGRGFEMFVKDTDNPYIVGDRIAAALVQTGYGEAPGQKPRAMDLNQPLGTVVAGGGKHALMAAHITKFKSGSTGHRLDEPLATVTSGGAAKRPAGAAHGLGLVTASLIQYYSGGGQNSAADQPLPTIVTKARIGVATTTLTPHQPDDVVQAAHLVGIDNQSNASGSWSAAEPLTTVTTENRHAVVVSNLVKLRGTSHAAAANEPLGTISAGGLHHGEVRTTLEKAGAKENAEYVRRRQQIREFLWEFCPSLAGVERPELVMIRGQLMEVTDIGLRMLVPRELANCQGFRRDYILDPFYTYTNKRGKSVTKRLPQHAQVRMIGNSVSPYPAAALLRANNEHEYLMARAA